MIEEQLQINKHLPTDPALMGELSWPDGAYSLPATADGCPVAEDIWSTGRILHDTTRSGRPNCWQPENIHLDLEVNEEYKMIYSFCTKTVAQSGNIRRPWQKGSYCICRYDDDDCPLGKHNACLL